MAVLDPVFDKNAENLEDYYDAYNAKRTAIK